MFGKPSTKHYFAEGDAVTRKRRWDEDEDDDRFRRAKRRRKSTGNALPWLIVGGVLLVVVAVGAFVLTRPRSPTTAQSPAAPGPAAPALAPLPTEPTAPQDVRDFGGPWDDFDNLSADTVVLHIHGVKTPRQHDQIMYTHLERLAPTSNAAGFIPGERREKWSAPKFIVTISPMRDVEGFARKIDFGRVVAVKGNVISIRMSE